VIHIQVTASSRCAGRANGHFSRSRTAESFCAFHRTGKLGKVGLGGCQHGEVNVAIWEEFEEELKALRAPANLENRDSLPLLFRGRENSDWHQYCLSALARPLKPQAAPILTFSI
jgi:hypothetical protein